MSDLVFTTRGDLPREQLQYTDVTTEDDKAIYTARTWTYQDEIVRRDAWVDLKRGESIEARKGN